MKNDLCTYGKQFFLSCGSEDEKYKSLPNQEAADDTGNIISKGLGGVFT